VLAAGEGVEVGNAPELEVVVPLVMVDRLPGLVPVGRVLVHRLGDGEGVVGEDAEPARRRGLVAEADPPDDEVVVRMDHVHDLDLRVVGNVPRHADVRLREVLLLDPPALRGGGEPLELLRVLVEEPELEIANVLVLAGVRVIQIRPGAELIDR
jgi:hypothetical protein